jgi:hypothetical protein
MSIFNIPLKVGTPQTFQIALGGVPYQLTLRYRNVDQGGWTLDIDDDAGNAVLHGIPLVTGVNLLAQYGYLGLGGGLYVQTTSDPDAVPTFENLGDDGLLYWVAAA